VVFTIIVFVSIHPQFWTGKYQLKIIWFLMVSARVFNTEKHTRLGKSFFFSFFFLSLTWKTFSLTVVNLRILALVYNIYICWIYVRFSICLWPWVYPLLSSWFMYSSHCYTSFGFTLRYYYHLYLLVWFNVCSFVWIHPSGNSYYFIYSIIH